MNRLRQAFDGLKAGGGHTLIPYITGGYPDVATTVEILKRLDPRRIGCAELGIPFSDPIADGPVIQTSFSHALDAGFRLAPLLSALKSARGEIRVPLMVMVSYSVVYRQQPARFIESARAAGIDGMIVPDLALEEADELVTLGRKHDFPLAMMIAPTSDESRRRRIAALSEPWVYYQSLTGVTGERAALPDDLRQHLEELRAETDKPICVGFGIARPDQVAAVCQAADGVIVGSAIVRRMNDGVSRGDDATAIADSVCAFIDELAEALPG